MRWAVVENGVVVNVVEWDGDLSNWTPPEGATLVELDGERCNLGDTYDPEQRFAPPVELEAEALEVAEAAPDYRAIAADTGRTVDERIAALLALIGG